MIGVQAVVIPIGMALIARHLGVGFADRLRVTWRPMVGTAAMSAALLGVLWLLPSGGGALNAAVQLALAVPAGALALVASVYMSWRLAHCPPGPEHNFMALLRSRWPRREVPRNA